MEKKASEPGPQEKRFAAYMEGLAKAAGHADRETPLKNYCAGLLLPGERKSVEPMAARLATDNIQRMHPSLHHLVADAPWNDEEMLRPTQSASMGMPDAAQLGIVIATSIIALHTYPRPMIPLWRVIGAAPAWLLSAW